MTTTTPTATTSTTATASDIDLVGGSGGGWLFSSPPVADEYGVRRFGELPAVVHYKAVDALGKREKRSRFWAEDHRRVVTEAVSSNEFRVVCRANEVEPGTVMQYLFACMQDSDRFGKDIATGVKKLAARIGKSERQTHRARRVARLTGFERFAKRSWQEPNQGNTWKRTSTLVRPMMPKKLARKVEEQRLNAARRMRAARRKKAEATVAGSDPATKPPSSGSGCGRCGGVGTFPAEQPDGTFLATVCPCSPP